MTYERTHTIENGIERIVYTPADRRFKTPIVMQHGMWHGAWCWQHWQEWFAEWGWETHAHSLPGHGGSPVRRPIRWCTLGYYLDFLKAEIERFPARPVLMGHSMGGALTQWTLKKVTDDFPAAVLVAPWTSHDMVMQVLRDPLRDPVGVVLSVLTLTTTPTVRNPRCTARMFITEGALLTPDELHARVGPESLWVLLQYNPIMWQPKRNVQTPLLWIGGGGDRVIPAWKQRRSAKWYGAEYVEVEGEGHNLMIERSARQTAETIHNWLADQGIE
jgi:pimeloyl-ACP methyl ester carboxylesterase